MNLNLDRHFLAEDSGSRIGGRALITMIHYWNSAILSVSLIYGRTLFYRISSKMPYLAPIFVESIYLLSCSDFKSENGLGESPPGINFEAMNSDRAATGFVATQF